MVKLLALIILTGFAGMTTLVGDSRDINDKLIATTIAVDKKDGEIWFYVEFANIEAGKGSTDSANGASGQYYVVKSHGKTFVEARADLNRQLDKPLYMGGVRTLLLTQRFSEEELLQYLYRLRADETYRKKVITITTRDDLDALFKTVNDKGQSVGYSVENTIKTLDGQGGCFLRTTSRLLENLSDTYTGILIPSIGLRDEETTLMGYTVVNDTRAVGFIPIDECAGVNLLKSDGAMTFYVVPFRDLQLTVETTLQKRKLTAAYSDGRARLTFSLRVDATVEYGDKKTPYDLTDADCATLTQTVEGLVARDVQTAFQQAQDEFKTDYLQCDDAFRVKYPVLFDSLDWGETFVQADMNVDVQVDLSINHMLDYSDGVAR
jgi:Ger(x)C family germination protein